MLCKKLDSVLIETYWNVKNGFRKIRLTLTEVLIETYWNVKFADRMNSIRYTKY